MPENRFFSPQPFLEKKIIELEESELHHLKVMRIKPNESVELVNGKNQLALASLISQDSKKALLRIEKVTEKRNLSEFILALSFLRQSKLDLILEKATELGITQFFLFPSQNSELDQLSSSKKERMETILISALKQSGRLDLPKIFILKRLSEFKNYNFDFFYGDINGGSFSSPINPPCFFIGPEKGFSADEILALKDSLNAKSVNLSSNILRSETAAICASFLMCYP